MLGPWVGLVAAGSALAAWLGPRCDVGLFLFHAGLLEPGDLEAFARAGGRTLVVKVLDGTRPFQPEATLELMASARRAGLAVEGWGYHYCRSVGEAVAEGAAAAARVEALGLRRYYWDAEDEWAHSAAVPAVTARAWLGAYRQGTRAEAWWASYSAAVHDGEAAADDPATEAPYDVLAEWDGYAPQCYGTTSRPGESDKRLYEIHVQRIEKGRLAGVPVAPIVSTGDVDKVGRHWTPWRGPYGVEAVVRDLRLRRLLVWYGSNSRGRMTRSGRFAPPLTSLVQAARFWRVDE